MLAFCFCICYNTAISISVILLNILKNCILSLRLLKYKLRKFTYDYYKDAF